MVIYDGWMDEDQSYRLRDLDLDLEGDFDLDLDLVFDLIDKRKGRKEVNIA